MFSLLAAHTVDGSIHQICMDWRHLSEMCVAGRRVYSELKNLCVWNKNNAGMGSFYRSKHELVFVWKNGQASHINNFELGQHGRSRSNVWDYAGVNTFRSGRLEELDDASDREACGADRGCHQGLLQARSSGTRPLCRQRKHHHCGASARVVRREVWNSILITWMWR